MDKLAVTRRGAIGAFGFGVISTTILNGWTQEVVASAAFEGTKQFPLRLLFNENPLGCSPKAKQAAIDSLSQANFYPYELASSLASKLQDKHGVSDQMLKDFSIAVSCGSSELLLAATLAYTLQAGNIVVPHPTYESVANIASTRPGPAIEVRAISLLGDGSLDVDRMISAMDQETRILAVTNPNNPTGKFLHKASILRLIQAAPPEALVLIDEAYIDFIDDAESQSMIHEALNRQNVLVVRTFSKLYGLAGLRIGYAVGHRSIHERMRHYRVGTFSLNACGLAAAIASLDDVEFQNASRAMAHQSRSRIKAHLETLGFKVVHSDAACLWADWGKETSDLVSRLMEKGIQISGGKRWQSPTCIRISVGTSWQTDKLLQGFTEAVNA